MHNSADDIDRYDPEDVAHMRHAIDGMKRSVPEIGRKNPGVGAVIVLPTGEEFEAHRALLRDGDHCEQTLLDKGPLANRDIRGSRLYVTLEPCSKRPTQTPCAKRIIEAGISRVFYGIRDPNPTINGGGIAALVEAGIEVRRFPASLAGEVSEANAEWLVEMERQVKAAAAKAAREKAQDRRAAAAPAKIKGVDFLARVNARATTDDLSDEAVSAWLKARALPDDTDVPALCRALYKAGLAADDEPGAHLTNLGVVLLAANVRDFVPQAGIVMIRQNPDGSTASHRVEVPIALAWRGVLAQLHAPDWFPTRDVRGGEERVEGVSALPVTAIREGAINGIAHRDYAKPEPVEMFITPDEIRITSPGGPVRPVRPVRIEDLRALKAKRALRNATLFQQMTKLRLVEQGHLGMETFRNLPKTDGLPIPVYADQVGVLTLTIFRTAEATAKVVTERGVSLTKAAMAGWIRISGLEEVSTYGSDLELIGFA